MSLIRNELLDLIRRWEGLRLKAYLCPANVWTIGYGHTKGVKPGDVWTPEQAEEALVEDARVHIEQTLVLCPTLDNERLSAIADFTFNLGAGRLKASSLRRRINNGEFELVPQEIRKWVWAGGRKLAGLVARREDEVRLWEQWLPPKHRESYGKDGLAEGRSLPVGVEVATVASSNAQDGQADKALGGLGL